ncbi:hypothetical protein EX895_004911 [Sporisorium graminicola]|uniref:Uncharacterized protein n=1 Tax=Sporisorium graminicola TaxID=280036 RepID=A0A4U7KQ31_9BASI|nr:hypothetical protein EX895_004911 [Sporisorium graminicola]TKY86086.1 hypothetical protein EX895_004911 [Sporisorium graminicola]
MVALALPRRQKDSGSGSGENTPSSEAPPPLAAVHAASFSGRPSHDFARPEGVADPERVKPKRSSSFGRGLGQFASLTSAKPKAVDIMSFGRTKSGASTPQSPSLVPATDNVTGAAAVLANAGASTATIMGPPSTPDPSHLTHFSLRLSELVNKAFVPCTAGAAPPASTTSVASNVAAATKGPTAPKINNITYEGKHLPDKAKIIEIAQTVVGELRYAEAVDAYLLRAVSRQILKALTLFAARIDSLLVSPSKDPGAIRIPTNAKEGLYLPAAMEFNLGLVTLEWIVEDSLERCIEGDRDAHGELIADENGAVHDGMPHFVFEILTPVRKRMEGTILHIIQPILAQTKQSMARCISTAVPTPFVSPVTLSPATTSANGKGAATAPATAAGDSGAVSPPVSAAASTTALLATTPGNVSPPLRLGETGPGSAWLRELDGRLEGARKLLLPRIEERCGQDGEGWFISVAIHTIWKGLMILTARSVSLPSNAAVELLAGSNAASTSAFDRLMCEVQQKRSPSPAQLASALKAVGVGSARSKSRSNEPASHCFESGRQSPSHCAASGMSSIAPFSLVSARLCAHQLAELQTFEKLMLRFCDGFLRKPGTQSKKTAKVAKRSRFALFSSGGASLGGAGVQPTLDLSAYDPDEEDELARAALAEAMHALRSTIIVLQSLEREPATICAGLEQLKSLPGADGADASSTAASAALGTEAAKALDAIPNLLLLHILYNRLPLGIGRLELPSPPALFGYTWTDYAKAIAGFAGGEQWAQAVALRYKPEIEKAWRSIAIRKDEKLAALEQKLAQGGKAGAARGARSASGTLTRTKSSLARGGSLHSEEEDDDDDGDADGDVPEAMSQSVPELQKPNKVSDSSDDHLSGGDGVGSVGGGVGFSRGRLSPGHSPRRSSTLAHPAMAEAAAATTAASGSTPRFWRRSTSNGRTGFHLSFSGLRATSPRTESPSTPPMTSATANDPLAAANALTSSPPASTPTLIGSPAAETFGSPPRAATSAGSEVEVVEAEKVLLEAKLEKRSLGVFATALMYAGRGSVSIELR